MIETRTRIIKFLILLIIMTPLFVASSPMKKKAFASVDSQTIVFFRYDDVSSKSASSLEQKILRDFIKRQTPVTFGVIPFIASGDYHETVKQNTLPLSTIKAQMLTDGIHSGFLDVAMHGYSHQTTRSRDEGGLTEFSGVGSGVQIKLLGEGKGFLEDILNSRISTFIPPFNSYDSNTLHALEDLGFETLSANRHGPSLHTSKLNYLPITCELSSLVEAIQSINGTQSGQSIIGVMFHEYDFVEVDPTRGGFTYEQFLSLLDWTTNQKNIKIMSINQIVSVIDDLGSHRYLQNKGYSRAFGLLPRYVASPDGVYLPTMSARIKERWVRICVAASYLVVMFASFFVTCWARSRYLLKGKLLRAVLLTSGTGVIAIILLYSLGLKEPGYRGVTVLSALLGGFVGAGFSCVITTSRGFFADFRRSVMRDSNLME